MLSPTTSVEYEHPNVFTVLPNPHGPNAADEADAILANLQENRFVDLRTRAVFVDFTIYNPMLDFSCVIRMAGELPDSGPWHTFAPLAWRVQYALTLCGGVPCFPQEESCLSSASSPCACTATTSSATTSAFWRRRWCCSWSSGTACWSSSACSATVRIPAIEPAKCLALHHPLTRLVCLVVFGVLAWLHTGVRRHLAKLGNIAHILNLCLFFVSTGYRVWSVIELPDDVDPDSNTFVNFRTAADKLKTATDINALYDLHSGASLSLLLSFTVACSRLVVWRCRIVLVRSCVQQRVPDVGEGVQVPGVHPQAEDPVGHPRKRGRKSVGILLHHSRGTVRVFPGLHTGLRDVTGGVPEPDPVIFLPHPRAVRRFRLRGSAHGVTIHGPPHVLQLLNAGRVHLVEHVRAPVPARLPAPVPVLLTWAPVVVPRLYRFIAIISDAFAETKAELDELEDVGVDTIGKAVTRIVLNDGLYVPPPPHSPCCSSDRHS